MEVFNVNKCTDESIELKDEKQMETLYELIKDSAEVLIRWEEEETDEDYAKKKSRILITDGLMSRIKDGRFIITSSANKD